MTPKSPNISRARKSKAAKGKRAAARTSKPPAGGDESAAARGLPTEDVVSPLGAYRMRLRLIGPLLNAAVSTLAEDDGSIDAVGRGAYLYVLGQVFEALDGLSQAIPLDDLVKLSKVVAEQRKAELHTRKLEDTAAAGGRCKRAAGRSRRDGLVTEDADFATRRLPERFGDIVRQIYGTSLAGDAGSGSDGAKHSAPEAKVSSEAGL